MKTVLTIAGSDSSGGAGIQADIKTMTVQGVYAMSAITALTAQNTTEVAGIYEVSPDFLKKQLDAVFTDIFPDAVKIGMLPNADLIQVVIDSLQKYQPHNIIVDPVMVSTSGSVLMQEEALAMLKELYCFATLVTPNILEAEILSGRKIQNAEEMEQAAVVIREQYGCRVLLKGGHLRHSADDVLCTQEGLFWFYGKQIANPNTHGTGCTLSSAIACNMAKGMPVAEAVQRAKDYLSFVLSDKLDLGKGSGPLNHMAEKTDRLCKQEEKTECLDMCVSGSPN